MHSAYAPQIRINKFPVKRSDFPVGTQNKIAYRRMSVQMRFKIAIVVMFETQSRHSVNFYAGDAALAQTRVRARFLKLFNAVVNRA